MGAFLGSKGWRSGESARLPPMWPRFKSRRRRLMWVEFVVGSLLCSERYRVLRFSPLLKNHYLFIIYLFKCDVVLKQSDH